MPGRATFSLETTKLFPPSPSAGRAERLETCRARWPACSRKDVSHCMARYNVLGAREKRFASRIGGYVIIAEKKYFAVDAIRYPAKQPTFFVNSF